MKKLTPIFFLFFSLNSIAQSTTFKLEGQFFEDGSGKLVHKNANINDEIEGNKFLPEAWQIGSVTLGTGQILNYKSLRFNMLSGELEYLWGEDAYAVTQPIVAFTIGEMNFKNGFQTFEKYTNKTFYQLVYNGKIKLLCNKAVQIVGATPFVTVTTKARQYQQADQYFIQKANGNLMKIKNDKRSILQVFPEKESKINDFCKKENIKFKKVEDLAKLMAFLDEK